MSSGIVALILRDAKVKGIWTIRREIGILTELASLVKAQRTKRFVGKAVLPDTAADDEGVVNFTASGIQAGGETYTAAQYAGRIAGILAGTPADCSATYAALSEVTGAAAVENPDATVEDEYLGRCANSYDNKCILLTAFRDFLDSLEAQNVLTKDSSGAELDAEAIRTYLLEEAAKAGNMTEAARIRGLSDDALRRESTGSHVFLSLYGRVMDAMEDFHITLEAQ
nr:hypothetical protein [uncultured Oscillibacter sp.]